MAVLSLSGTLVDVEQLGGLSSTYTSNKATNGNNQPINLYEYYYGGVRVEAADFSHVSPFHGDADYYAAPRGLNLRRHLLAPSSAESLLRRDAATLRGMYGRRALSAAEEGVRNGAVTFFTTASAVVHPAGVTFVIAPVATDSSISSSSMTMKSCGAVQTDATRFQVTARSSIRNRKFTFIGQQRNDASSSFPTVSSSLTPPPAAAPTLAITTMATALDGTVGATLCTACSITMNVHCYDDEETAGYDPGVVLRGRHAHPLGLSLRLRFDDDDAGNGVTSPSQSVLLRVPRSIDEAAARSTILDPATSATIRFPNAITPNRVGEFQWFVNPDLIAAVHATVVNSRTAPSMADVGSPCGSPGQAGQSWMKYKLGPLSNQYTWGGGRKYRSRMSP